MNLVGKTIGGKYKVLEQIGSGGMAVVYRGEHIYLKKPVAIKVMLPSFSEKPELVQRFLQEAEMASKLDHPNIVKIFDFGDEDGLLYLVMQFIDGDTLERILRHRGKLSLHEAINITLQVLSALQYAHEKGLVHRDIKSGNVMINREGRAYLLDFGIAVLGGMGGGEKAAAGTPEYMAPEQFRGRADRRSDLYSVGVMLYEMLTGKTPFQDAKDIYELQHRILRDPIPPTGIDPEIDTILEKALSKLPSQRFQSAKEFADALLSIEEAKGMEYNLSIPVENTEGKEKEYGMRKITQFVPLPEEEEFEIEDKGFPWRLFIILVVLGILIFGGSLGILWYILHK
jgi:Serine/threonine protein kinase